MPDLKTINDVEIFAAGTWNGDTFTEKDIQQIADSFAETKDKLKPFLKIGHSEKQALLAKDEMPSCGLITNVRRAGRKLLADFKNVPKKIFDLIKRKAFDKISSELFVNMNVSDKRHPFALKAVALLGGGNSGRTRSKQHNGFICSRRRDHRIPRRPRNKTLLLHKRGGCYHVRRIAKESHQT